MCCGVRNLGARQAANRSPGCDGVWLNRGLQVILFTAKIDTENALCCLKQNQSFSLSPQADPGMADQLAHAWICSSHKKHTCTTET